MFRSRKELPGPMGSDVERRRGSCDRGSEIGICQGEDTNR